MGTMTRRFILALMRAGVNRICGGDLRRAGSNADPPLKSASSHEGHLPSRVEKPTRKAESLVAVDKSAKKFGGRPLMTQQFLHARRALGLAVVLLALAAPTAWGTPPKAEDFFARPALDQVSVSPSGQHLAMRVTVGNGRRHLAVMTLAPPWKTDVIAGFADADVDRVHWVNDERLVFASTNRELDWSDLKPPGLYAVNRDGTGQRPLIDHGEFIKPASAIESRVLPWNWFFYSTVNDGSPDVIVGERTFNNSRELKSISVSRLNTVTGERRLLTLGQPEGAVGWLLDHRGQPRVVGAVVGERFVLHWRAGAEASWQPIASFERYLGKGFTPVFVDPDGSLLVSVATGGRDIAALHRYDVAKRELDPEPLISLKDFDLAPSFQVEPASGRILGVNFVGEAPGSYWFDKDLRALQAGIDRALPPGRSNTLLCSDCRTAPALVVRSSSDKQPGEYYLFDRKSGALQRLAAANPKIDEKTQAARSFHRVKARDGLMLPVFVTRPVGTAQQPLPTVVLVHGGPWVRGHRTTWSAAAQFLASRGYLVLEVEYRGSIGYGTQHFQAGWKQWGLAMQDDLADALDWAADEKLADPKRACIAGGSYGGYAALMGPIRHPDHYRCAISWMGVTDIDLMYSNTWSDFSADYKRYGMPVLIGDRSADAAQLAATSPLKNAARIRVPILLAGGAFDRRVPIEHQQRFRDEAQKAGVAVEWVEYPGEGHGWAREANEVDFWQRVERFLARHLADAKSP